MIKELQSLSTKLKQTLWKSNGALDVSAWCSEARKILTSRFSMFGNVSGTKLCGRLVNSIRCGETFLTASNQSQPEKLVNRTVKNIWHENELEKKLVTETRKKKPENQDSTILNEKSREQDDNSSFCSKLWTGLGDKKLRSKSRLLRQRKLSKIKNFCF